MVCEGDEDAEPERARVAAVQHERGVHLAPHVLERQLREQGGEAEPAAHAAREDEDGEQGARREDRQHEEARRGVPLAVRPEEQGCGGEEHEREEAHDPVHEHAHDGLRRDARPLGRVVRLDHVPARGPGDDEVEEDAVEGEADRVARREREPERLDEPAPAPRGRERQEDEGQEHERHGARRGP